MKVSVCIPIYKVEKYIEQCARSLFEQTIKEEIEFIFVDDCTPDKSIEILENVLAEYPNRKDQVTILHHKKNKGLVASRNTALTVARGDYIIHCDSDDWVDLNMYESMYNKAIETNADMVYCGIVMCYDDGRKKNISIKEYLSSDMLFKKMSNPIVFNSLCNKIFKREIALSADIKVPDHICMSEDLLRSSLMLAKCKSVACSPHCCYHYRQNTMSLVYAWKKESFISMQNVYSILHDNLPTGFKPYLISLYVALFIKALLHYGDSPEDNLLFREELNKKRGIKNIVAVIASERVQLQIKIIYVCGVINFMLTSKIIRYLNKKLKLNK